MAETVEIVGARITVSGRVQGVAYRAFACDVAERLGIRGWVKNLLDGRVQIEAHGVREGIEAMIDRLRQGPPRAVVSDVQTTWLQHSAGGRIAPDFRIVY